MPPTPPPSHRVLLRDEDTDDFLKLCRSQRWPLAFVDEENVGDLPFFMLTFQHIEDGTVIEWIDDTDAHRPRVDIRGPSQEAIADLLANQLNTLSVEQALIEEASASEETARADALIFLGVVSPIETDQRVVQRLSARLGDPSPMVRDAALIAIQYRMWPVLLHAVSAHYADESHEEVRSRMTALLDSHDELAPNAAKHPGHNGEGQ